MSSIIHQIAIAVVTASAVSFASVTFHAGSTDRQIKINTEEISKHDIEISKIKIMENEIYFMQKRLDTYENIVIDGQKEILKEVAEMNIQAAKSSTRIGSIEVDISEIKERINK